MQALSDFRQSEMWRRVQEIDLVFTVTSGRSGTRLLTTLLAEALGAPAFHEPEPRANFELRKTIENPAHGIDWLVHQKLPHIAEIAEKNQYIETSHLYCKGFIELFVEIGLRPRFIILRRGASAVARSLYQLSCIPDAPRLAASF